jgi:pathogenesis-related protein 1
MKMLRTIFAFAFAVLFIGSAAFDRDRTAQSAEVQAGRYETAGTRDTRRDYLKAAGVKTGSVGSRLTVEEARQVLAAHNAARSRVGISPLIWSESLARYAQEWADHLASTIGGIEHRPHSGKWKQKHGENLFMGTVGYYGVTDAVGAWENERAAYHGGAIEMSNFFAYGHYTQLVWRDTRDLGCAKAEHGGNLIVVCNYDPPGNTVGRTPY